MEINRIHNISAKEIANHVVSMGSKGIWVFSPTPVPHRPTEIQSPIDIYGYANDGRQLSTLTCE